MHDAEIDISPTEEIEALEHVIEELTRAIDMTEMPTFERLRDLLIQARSKAEEHLGRPPASKLQ